MPLWQTAKEEESIIIKVRKLNIFGEERKLMTKEMSQNGFWSAGSVLFLEPNDDYSDDWRL